MRYHSSKCLSASHDPKIKHKVHTTSSITQYFYHYLDLPEREQDQWIKQLKINDEPGYQALRALVASSNQQDFSLSQVLATHAVTWHQATPNYTGQQIDKYQLTQEIGRGGMGVVYAAHRADNTFEQQLAIKFIQPEMSQLLGHRALFAEAQLLAKLDHPAIAKVFDGGVYNDQVYIVMERIDGLPLDQHLQQHHLSLQQRLKLFNDLCRAVEHAHHHQILHADLKPENILVTRHHQVKLIDFNLTQKLQHSHKKDENFTFKALSVEYASPEQKRGDYLTQQSDLYSLGKVLAHLLTGQAIGQELPFVIHKATADDICARYSNVGELRQDIEALLTHHPIKQKATEPFYIMRCFVKRRPMVSLLSLSLMVMGLVFTYTLLEKNRQLEQEQRVTEQMLLQLTQLMYHTQNGQAETLSVQGMLDITRRQLLTNPEIPHHIKQKLLTALMTPTPDKQKLTLNCRTVNCSS
nr:MULTISPECIES: serine/threonine-protein kinase [unclassified Vibrio]